MSAFGGKADIGWTFGGVRPCWWTVSGGGFDRLLGVSILVLHGAQIAQRGMESASVVNLIDEAGKISCNVLKDFVGHQIHGFTPARALLWAVRVAPSEVPSPRVARSPSVLRSRCFTAS
jgi:hypothetical protein